jgi:hypothetical protein
MRLALDALVKSQDCIQRMTDGPHKAAWGEQLDVNDHAIDALTAALAEPSESVAAAWAEGYRTVVEDERTSEANIGIAGFDAKVNPARQNPYRNMLKGETECSAPNQWHAKRLNRTNAPTVVSQSIRATSIQLGSQLMTHGSQTRCTKSAMTTGMNGAMESIFRSVTTDQRKQNELATTTKARQMAARTMLPKVYTEAQLIAYGRQCVEAAVNLYSRDDTAMDYFNKVYDMLKGETEWLACLNKSKW